AVHMRVTIPRLAKGLQCLERARRRFLEGIGITLYRRQGFSGPHTELAGNLIQGGQNIFLSRRLHLLAVEKVAGAAVLGLKSDHELAPERVDRTFQHRCAAGTLTYGSRDFRRQPGLGFLAHKRQVLADSIVRDNTQVRRLLKFERETFTKSTSIEDGVAGFVGELREHDRVSSAEFGSRMIVAVIAECCSG